MPNSSRKSLHESPTPHSKICVKISSSQLFQSALEQPLSKAEILENERNLKRRPSNFSIIPHSQN